MIKKLRRLSTGALMTLDEDPSTSNTVEPPEQLDEPDQISDTDETHPASPPPSSLLMTVADEKKQLIRQKKKLKRQLKRLQQKAKELATEPSTVVSETVLEVVSIQKITPSSHLSPAVSSVDENISSKKRHLTESSTGGSCESLDAKRTRKLLKTALNIQNPIQPKGVFACPIINCQTSVPFCRLLNHIRWNHNEFLAEIECECFEKAMVAKVDVQIRVPVDDYRYIVHVREFGLFVVVFKAIREMIGEECAINDVTAFVKMVGTVSMAKSFSYDIKVSIGKYVAAVSDMCHHAFTNEEELPVQEQCLNLKVSKLSKFANVQVKFTKNSGSRTRKPIKQETFIIPNFGSTNHQGEASSSLHNSNVNHGNNKKRNKNRNKNRKR